MTSLLPFRWHIAEVLIIVAAGVVHHVVVPSKRERRLALYALLALLVVTVWPVGDLAASVSLTVATIQRLVIMLLVAPLLLMATPTSVLARLTRPRPIDAVTRLLAHPGFAVAIVTALGTATLVAPVVDWGARSSIGRDLVLLAVLFVGFVLWLPGLGVLPGAKRLSPAGRAGYIFASALVVTSLSFVWIFSQHPLYPALHHQYALLHITPLFDQQLAGFVAKLGCYIPMWAVAFTIFFHAEERGTPIEETPLHWADVERQLLRVDRQRERAVRRHQPE
ncbi:MAG TPA: cytochrome c oxidase assembly protein [Acidimicrobiales bacterium]